MNLKEKRILESNLTVSSGTVLNSEIIIKKPKMQTMWHSVDREKDTFFSLRAETRSLRTCSLATKMFTPLCVSVNEHEYAEEY